MTVNLLIFFFLRTVERLKFFINFLIVLKRKKNVTNIDSLRGKLNVTQFSNVRFA